MKSPYLIRSGSLLLLALMLGMWVRPCEASEIDKERLAARAIRALERERGTNQGLRYTEETWFGDTYRRFDWIVGSFPSGRWRLESDVPTHDSRREKRLYVCAEGELLVAVLTPDGEWSGQLGAFDEMRIYTHTPMASRLFPVGRVRIDEHIKRWDVLDAEDRGDAFAITIPANDAAQRAILSPGSRILGLVGYRFEFGSVGGRTVLTRCDILSVSKDRSGEPVTGVTPVDNWRRKIGDLEVCRTFSRVWSEFLMVGDAVLALSWAYHSPRGKGRGRIDVSTISRPSDLQVVEATSLQVPSSWPGRGALVDMRTGDTLERRAGNEGEQRDTLDMPAEYKVESRSRERTSEDHRDGTLWIGLGLLGLAAFVWGARRIVR